MTTINANVRSSYYSTGSSEVKSTSDSSSTADNSIASTSATQSTSVTLSGQSIMLSRLYNVDNASDAPPVRSGVDGMSLANATVNSYEFLTNEDRSLISDLYAYASSEGADLRYVDRIARDLGNYRKTNDGQIMSNYNSGHMFDSTGHLQTISFTASDAQTADEILNGTAIGSTRFDKGFLQHILDPGYGAFHLSDFSFLEKAVTEFSNSTDTSTALGSEFQTFKENNKNYVMNVSEEVVLKPQDSAQDTNSAVSTDNGSLLSWVQMSVKHLTNVSLLSMFFRQ